MFCWTELYENYFFSSITWSLWVVTLLIGNLTKKNQIPFASDFKNNSKKNSKKYSNRTNKSKSWARLN